ncbi:MAG TPA: multiheme c-type cytochrome [Candidatus Acidoferrum sp.]|nr:multiheme c-type cytochrome [Candidatus Acidoferrum sp.]
MKCAIQSISLRALIGCAILVAAPRLPAQNAKTANAGIKYIGPGSCAATACHGSVKPVAESRILQNEYSTWILKDKHARAYQALTGDVGERMGRILKLGAKAEESPKCLACHALYTTPEQRGRPFEITEGVSCENCHGPAQAWLGQHTERESPEKHARSLTLGMADTRDVIHRTEKCLQCHLGTKEKFVDHEMIAAGHPDLFFELDSFSAVMPRHWKQPRESAPNKPAEDPNWTSVRDWSAGQAVQLRAAMERLTWRARNERFDHKDIWPEYSELSCFACHHSLGPAQNSWRQEHGYAGRRPGDPAWNASRYVVFRVLARQIDPGVAQELDERLASLAAEMSKLNPDRTVVLSATTAAAPVAQRFAERLASMNYDSALTLRTLQAITQDADAIALGDERAAEQATMALDSLYIAYSKQANPSNAADVRSAINGLFQQLDNPSAYNADQFASALRRIHDLLH